MPDPSHPPSQPHTRRPVDLAAESVAGEEDPGASIDVAASPAPMAPGDQAPPGAPGTGENVCPVCGGSGRLGGQACGNCQGTGRVTVGIGGA